MKIASFLALKTSINSCKQDPRASNTNQNKRGSESRKVYSILFASVEVQFLVGINDGVVVENVIDANLEQAEIVDGIPVIGS
jgi:membrane-anchored glycerophosphoryl diester phosphodiesterase (GDPDase)